MGMFDYVTLSIPVKCYKCGNIMSIKGWQTKSFHRRMEDLFLDNTKVILLEPKHSHKKTAYNEIHDICCKCRKSIHFYFEEKLSNEIQPKKNKKIKYKEMKVIYVAGPYTGDTKSQVEENIRKAEIVSIKLARKGWNVYTPHKNNAHYDLYEPFFPELTWDFWMERCYDMLRRCDAAIFLNDWKKSKGAKLEHAFAKKICLKVFYEKDGLPEPNI